MRAARSCCCSLVMLGGSYLPHVLSKLSNHMALAEGACVYRERSDPEVLWKPLTASYFVRSEASAPPLGTDRWKRDVCSCLVPYRQEVSHSMWSRLIVERMLDGLSTRLCGFADSHSWLISQIDSLKSMHSTSLLPHSSHLTGTLKPQKYG